MLPRYFPFLLVALQPLLAVSPDFTNMGRMLRDNRTAITFIDVAITNLTEMESGDNALKTEIRDKFGEALRLDFNSHLWYLQADYSRTYKDLKESQNILQAVYRRLLENYISETWVMLEEAAPMIVRTRDRTARHLLQLGYRDLETSRQFHQRGFNIKPTLHSNQIQFYTDGIKRIRRARRFAILALIEARLPPSEKAQFQVVTLDDIKAAQDGDVFRQSNYEKVKNMLVNMVGRQLVPGSFKVTRDGNPVVLRTLEVHQDNYSLIISDRRSVWTELVASLKADERYARRVIPPVTPDPERFSQAEIEAMKAEESRRYQETPPAQP